MTHSKTIIKWKLLVFFVPAGCLSNILYRLAPIPSVFMMLVLVKMLHYLKPIPFAVRFEPIPRLVITTLA